MSGSLIAVARTPWAPRHTALDGWRPEDLLTTALRAVVERAGVEAGSIDRVLVACDTGVGAQDVNIGRRAVLQADWTTTPALTVDGHGATGVALVGLAAQLPGLTVVAGVDASSMVPPGAGLVRDYGRPTLDQPEHRWLDSMAAAHGLDAAMLNAAVQAALDAAPRTTPAIVALDPSGPTADTEVTQEAGDPFQTDGVVAPHHLAPWADGAVAVLIGKGPGRAIDTSTFDAVPDDELIDRLIAPRNGLPVLVVDTSAVIAALADPLPAQVASPLAIGSTPSCDGLRVLADAASSMDGAFEIRTRGGHGQLATVAVGGAHHPVDASKAPEPT